MRFETQSHRFPGIGIDEPCTSLVSLKSVSRMSEKQSNSFLCDSFVCWTDNGQNRGDLTEMFSREITHRVIHSVGLLLIDDDVSGDTIRVCEEAQSRHFISVNRNFRTFTIWTYPNTAHPLISRLSSTLPPVSRSIKATRARGSLHSWRGITERTIEETRREWGKTSKFRSPSLLSHHAVWCFVLALQ